MNVHIDIKNKQVASRKQNKQQKGKRRLTSDNHFISYTEALHKHTWKLTIIYIYCTLTVEVTH